MKSSDEPAADAKNRIVANSASQTAWTDLSGPTEVARCAIRFRVKWAMLWALLVSILVMTIARLLALSI